MTARVEVLMRFALKERLLVLDVQVLFVFWEKIRLMNKNRKFTQHRFSSPGGTTSVVG